VVVVVVVVVAPPAAMRQGLVALPQGRTE